MQKEADEDKESKNEGSNEEEIIKEISNEDETNEEHFEDGKDSLEEKIEETEDFTHSENFNEFLEQPIIKSSPSLEEIQVPQGVSWRIDRGFASQDSPDEKNNINYLSPQGNSLKYEHMETHSLKKISFESEIKTPEKILDEQREIHAQTFVQDPRLALMKEKQEKEQGYIPNPEIRTKNEIDALRKDYKIKS